MVPGTTDNPSLPPPPRVTLGELTIHLFLLENSANRLHELFSGTRDN